MLEMMLATNQLVFQTIKFLLCPHRCSANGRSFILHILDVVYQTYAPCPYVTTGHANVQTQWRWVVEESFSLTASLQLVF